MLVRIVKDWHYPENFFGQTPNGDGQWGNVNFTEDSVPECDYLIVLQRPPYPIEVRCPEGNAWLITQEPPTNYFRFFTKSFKYFDRVYSYYTELGHPHIQPMQPVLPWHLLRSYAYLSSINKEQLTQKKDELAWITSNKTGFAGQTARMIFKEYLLKANFNLHLYGRGFTAIRDKFDGLFPCKYALAIENYSEDHYWTEKIADCFLSWCLPFYWGAKNLSDYFPPESFIWIDIHDPEKALETIRQAMINSEWEKRIEAIDKARQLVLNQYQFFPYMAKLIKEDRDAHPVGPKKDYVIPANPFPWSYKIINQWKYYWSHIFR